MQFFIDSCDIQKILQFYEIGLVDGVTTNPSLIAKSGRQQLEVLKEMCELIKCPISAQVNSSNVYDMLKEAETLVALGNQIVIKVPATWDGLKVCKKLSSNGVPVNVTLCFSTTQALLIAKAGAAYVSPFVGRLDDIGSDGISLIHDIHTAYSSYPDIETEILVASVRTPFHIAESAKLGADIVTVPPNVLEQAMRHPLTTEGLEIFQSAAK
ncbi:fructose-6-phosphate aldolase [Rickettsiales endosymbiont of Peranema trichophorum]|uniref:fructose-6-phosphate aldolase n=1 Tax=Rickettsiales endosymbiont of Peranema trichophorum TaxID=2486577 RepID=UPI001022D72A|nr:fructose-6-phosphate aldolase [Rickettsiales endosymbiont of Peranema trichophorum]RZI47301.1 fructose-6-phosphate aldolase [Rickettsiales endosymbiont of Peranema trichophorum]